MFTKIKNASLAGVSLLSLFSVLMMSVASAQNPLNTVQESVTLFGGIVNTAAIITVSIAFVYFFWNLGRYILKAGEDQEKARQGMIWGLIAVVVLTSMWGLITFIRNVFGFDAGTANSIDLPKVEQNQG